MQDFKRNQRGTNGGKDYPEEMLFEIYKNIKYVLAASDLSLLYLNSPNDQTRLPSCIGLLATHGT